VSTIKATCPTHKSILSLFFPEGFLDYFEIVDYQTKSTNKELFIKDLTIFLEEKKMIVFKII
jgi:hypothetical protein